MNGVASCTLVSVRRESAQIERTGIDPPRAGGYGDAQISLAKSFRGLPPTGGRIELIERNPECLTAAFRLVDARFSVVVEYRRHGIPPGWASHGRRTRW